jgi:hypothetical protein
MNHTESRSGRGVMRLSEKVRNLRVRHSDGEEVKSDHIVFLNRANPLNFILELDEMPENALVRVTLIINKRGPSHSGTSGPFFHAPLATTFADFSEVEETEDGTPFLKFSVIDPEARSERWHNGPGPYDTSIALTSTNEDGEPIEESTSAMSYGFTGK